MYGEGFPRFSPQLGRIADREKRRTIKYRKLCEEEICRELFGGFIRHQNVTKCWRWISGQWVIRDDPFVELWTLLGSIVYVIIYNLLALSYRCMKARLLTDARYYLKKDIFNSLMGRSVADFDTGSSVEYMNELSNNMNLFESVYWGNCINLLESLMSFVGAAAICIALQPLLLILMIFLALLSMCVTRLTTSPLEKSMESFAKRAESYTAEIKDDFGGFRLAYSYGCIPFILQKHDKKNRNMEDANRQNTNCRIFCAYAGNFVGLLSTVLVMATASYFALKVISMLFFRLYRQEN